MELIERLAGLDTLKVWSLLTTAFGDLAWEEGTWLEGPDLSGLMGQAGLRPEAVRVALHRLRRDGWIVSERQGRTSRYAMTSHAREETARVRPRVYDGAKPVWHLIVTEDTLPEDAVRLLAHVGVTSDPAGPDISAPLHAAHVPDWAADRVFRQGLGPLAEALADTLATTDLPIDEQHRRSTRLLVLHHWRRIALRDAALIHEAIRPDGPIARCRRAVAGVLDDG